MFHKAAALLLITACDAFSVVNLPAQEMIIVAEPALHQSVVASAFSLPSQTELLWSSNIISAATAPSPSQEAKSAPATKNLATNGVFITQIFYDGKVPTTEADEYIVLTNGSKSPVDVSGDYIYVATTGTQGPTFNFPKDSVIKPGGSVRIYTNEIHKETGGYSFRSGKAIWSNRGGLAVLKDSNGKKLGEFKYKPDTVSS